MLLLLLSCNEKYRFGKISWKENVEMISMHSLSLRFFVDMYIFFCLFIGIYLEIAPVHHLLWWTDGNKALLQINDKMHINRHNFNANPKRYRQITWTNWHTHKHKHTQKSEKSKHILNLKLTTYDGQKKWEEKNSQK